MDNVTEITNMSSEGTSSESQESVLYLGDYTLEGERINDSNELQHITNGQPGQEITEEISHSLETVGRAPKPNRFWGSSNGKSRNDLSTVIITAQHGTVTETQNSQQPVWGLSVIPLSDSPVRFGTVNSLGFVREYTRNQATEYVEENEGNNIQQDIINDNSIVNSSACGSQMRPISENLRSSEDAHFAGASTSSKIRQKIPLTPLTSKNKRSTQKRGSLNPILNSKRQKDCQEISTPGSVSSRSCASNADEVESNVEADENSQIVSIHRINIETAKRTFGKQADKYTELDFIEKIVEKSNKKIKGGEEDDGRVKNDYMRQEDFHWPTLAADVKKEFFSGDDFKCEIYVQQVTGNCKFLLGFGLSVQENNVNCIVFYYRKEDIFALTTRHAWNIIQWCCDFDFPSLIAARLLSPEGQRKSTDKELIGNVISTAKTRKTCEGENPLDIAIISTNYVADFRKQCSIFRLPCFNFNHTTDSNGRDNVRVEVGFGYIRILKKFSTIDLVLILSHLSLVNKGEETRILNTENIEKDSTAHAKHLTMVSYELGQILNLALIQKIYNAVHNSGKTELENFDFCHKYVEDYSLAENICLYVGKEPVHTFHTHPSLSQVIEFIMTSEIVSFRNLIHAKDIAEFKTKFAKFKVGYSFKGKKIAPEKILNFVEGDIIHSDGRLYCKYLTKWCSAAPRYFAVVHLLFLDILKKYLVGNDNFPDIQLNMSWPSSAEIRRQSKNSPNYNPIEEYLTLYKNEENHFIFENSLIECENSKLFDMMRIGSDGTIYVYIVQNGFNAKIRDVSSQIKRSLNKINISNYTNSNTQLDSFTESSNSKDSLRVFYMFCCDDNAFCQRFPDYNIFKEKFKNATFVFAIADIPVRSENRQNIFNYFHPHTSDSASHKVFLPRTFRKERELQTKLSVTELVVLLESNEYFTDEQLQEFVDIFDMACGTSNRSKAFCVANKIYDVLRQLKFLDTNSMVTSKLLLCSERLFEFSGLENHQNLRKAVFNIISAHQSQYRYLIPKLELIAIRNEIRNSGYEFLICQIPST